MANQNPNGKLTYWFQGVSSTLIKKLGNAPVANSKYWYNGTTEGFLLDSIIVVKPRNFATLIGF